MTLKAGDFTAYVTDRGTFVVDDGMRRSKVTSLEEFALVYHGPVEGVSERVVVRQCYIDSVTDFPAITFYTTTQETFV